MEKLIDAKSETANNSAVTAESDLFEAIHGTSHAGSQGAVVGINDNGTKDAGPGVMGKSIGTGVWGESESWVGVFGHSKSTIGGAGVWGEGEAGIGVIGKCLNQTDSAGPGVFGQSRGTGVWGESDTWMGVFGLSKSTTGGAGVQGQAEGPGPGVIGVSKAWHGVYGETQSTTGGAGVCGESTKGEGVRGISHSAEHGGVVGTNDNPGGIGIFGQGNRLAGLFQGDIEVTGDIRLRNADLAEDFDVAEESEPGEVMVLSENGTLTQSFEAYDKKVVGVISGAGSYKPGIILDKQSHNANRKSIAMTGKVFCKVDASEAPIAMGDLLTTSFTPGHAMKVTQPVEAFGAVIGKALQPLAGGRGIVPILVALQ